MPNRQVTFLINANAKAFKSGLKSAQSTFRKIGRNMERTGRKLTRTITVPLVAAGGAAVKFSSDFEDSLAEARAQADLTSDQVSFIGDAAEDTAIRTGESTSDIIEAYKFTISAGQNLAESQDTVTAAAEASAAGFGTQRDLVRLTTTALQAYGDRLDSSREFMDLLVGSAQAMELEVSKLGPAVQRNVGVAKELEVGLGELMRGIGSVSEIMGDAQRGGRMFQTMLSKLLKPSAAGEAAITEMFGSLENLHRSIREDGLLDTMVTLRQRLEEAGGGFEDVFSGQRGLEAALNFTNRAGQRTNEIMENAGDTAGSTADAFDESATFSRKLSQAWESLQAAMRPVGNILMDEIKPMLQDVTNLMQNMAGALEKVNPKIVRTGVAIAGIVAFVGPLIWGFGKLLTGVAALLGPVKAVGAALLWMGKGIISAVLVGSFTKFTAAMRLARIKGLVPMAKAIGAGAKAFALIALKVGAVIGIVGGLVLVAKSVFDAWDTVGPFFEQLWDKIVGTFAMGVQQVARLMMNMPGMEIQAAGIIGHMEAIKQKAQENIEARGIITFQETAGAVWDEMKDNTSESVDFIKDKFQGLNDFVSGLMPSFGVTSPAPSSSSGGSGGGSDSDEGDGSGAGGGFSGLSQETLDTFKFGTKLLNNNLFPTLQKAQSEWRGFSEELANELVPMISKAAGNAIGSFVEMSTAALASGKGLKGAFFGVLEGLADLAIRVGKIAIGVAVAIEGIKKALQSLNPVAAFAAGVALIALGSLTKSALVNAAEGEGGQQAQVPGMAMGGIVPSGFPNDTYPAALTSGEMVVPPPHSLPNNMGGGSIDVNITGEFRQQGSDLVAVIKEANHKINR